MEEFVDEFKLKEHYDIGEKFIYTTISDFIVSSVIKRVGLDPRIFKLLDYEEYQKPWWIETYEKLIFGEDIKIEKWVIVLKLNLDKLYAANIILETIAKKISMHFGKSKTGNDMVVCAYSPLIDGEIHVFIDFNDIFEYVRSKTSRTALEDSVLCNYESVLFYNVRDIFEKEISSIYIRGAPEITKIYAKKDPRDKSKWRIDAKGTGLLDIFARTYDTPEVDSNRTICDNMHEIYETLGIEATREFLINEINRVLSHDGTYINIRHISLLVDLMIRKGIITAVDRNGMGKDAGPMSAAMFEQTVKIITSCAATTNSDNIKSISSAVLLGELSNIGANTVKVIPKDRTPITM